MRQSLRAVLCHSPFVSVGRDLQVDFSWRSSLGLWIRCCEGGSPQEELCGRALPCKNRSAAEGKI